jgi:malate synthase
MEDTYRRNFETQVWQWLRNEVALEDGRLFTTDLYKNLLTDELVK